MYLYLCNVVQYIYSVKWISICLILNKVQHELHAYKQCTVATEKEHFIVCFPFKRVSVYEVLGEEDMLDSGAWKHQYFYRLNGMILSTCVYTLLQYLVFTHLLYQSRMK